MIIQITGGFGTVVLDQGYWQRAIASEAKTAVRAYLMGGIAWFAVPLAFSSVMGLAAVALANSPWISLVFRTSPLLVHSRFLLSLCRWTHDCRDKCRARGSSGCCYTVGKRRRSRYGESPLIACSDILILVYSSFFSSWLSRRRHLQR